MLEGFGHHTVSVQVVLRLWKHTSDTCCMLRNRTTLCVNLCAYLNIPRLISLFSLQTQLTTTQTQVTTVKSSSESTLQLKISELLTMLEARQTTITRQEEVCNTTQHYLCSSSAHNWVTKLIVKTINGSITFLMSTRSVFNLTYLISC